MLAGDVVSNVQLIRVLESLDITFGSAWKRGECAVPGSGQTLSIIGEPYA
jgi:hypothetical protein